MIKIALIVVAVIALGVFAGLETWSKHQEQVKAAQVQELMRQLGVPTQYQTPTPAQQLAPQPHTPWSPVQ